MRQLKTMRVWVAVGAIFFGAVARADEAVGYVENYVEGGSFSLMTSVDAASVRYSYVRPETIGSGTLMLRFAAWHFLFGLGVGVYPYEATASAGIEPRLSLGFAIPLGHRVALSPAARAGLLINPGPNPNAVLFGLEVPVTIYLASKLFVEPYAGVGGYLSWGIAPMFSGGVRLGWTF